MADCINFYTVNVRSLAGSKKCQELSQWFKGKPQGILMMQETHSQEEYLNSWQQSWNSKFYCSHGARNARGVAL